MTVDEILASMTLEEKVGQMTQLTVGAVTAADSPLRRTLRLDPDRLREALVGRHVGSIINILGGSLTLDGWRQALQEIQEVAVRETRLGIPVLYGIDHVHGANYVIGGTIFPHNLGLAATFDTELARRIGEVTARETLAAGLPWNFSPVLDVGRQPLWPRFYETLGESEWLVARLGESMIRGLQEGSGGRLAATAKHYLAYSGPTGGRDRTPALLGRRTVRDQFLPPFARAVAAGVKTVMVNSGEIDGEPVHASRYWLTEVLREELGFEGVVVTDWADITFLHTRHRVAPSLREATRMAVEAGIDVAMTPDNYDFHDALVELVRDGVVSESRVDASVRRVLGLKFELGLFDRPVPEPLGGPTGTAAASGGVGRTVSASGAAADPALAASRACMTLLSNDGVLPLEPGARVLLAGPASASRTALAGAWTHSWQGDDPADLPATMTLLDAVRSRAGAVEHVGEPGFGRDADAGPDLLARVTEAAARADVAIVALGEDAYAEWAGDIRDLALPEAQLRTAEAAIASGTPTVLVLVQGRPRLIERVADGAAAVLLAYWPGVHGGRAIAEALFGEINPSGRLPFTYPRFANDAITHDHKFTETMDTRLEPRGPGGYDPRFEFGHGLAYTTFEYSGLRVSAPEIGPGDELRVAIEVENTGSRRGTETVLLFIRQHYGSLTPHVRRLRGVRKVELEPGERRAVEFVLDRTALASVGRDGAAAVEPGCYDVVVGPLDATFSVRVEP